MLTRMLSAAATMLLPRDKGWPRARATHLVVEPQCMNVACAATTRLEVHHVEPVHVAPSKELDPANMITLCRRCHWRLGHDGRSWLDWNPDVRAVAARGVAFSEAKTVGLFKRFFGAIALALVLTPVASAQYGGYKTGYYAPTYSSGYGSHCATSYSYAPSYSYWHGGWDGPRWYQAGYYAKINGYWHRQGYGVDYGLSYDPYAVQAPTYPQPYPVGVPAPPTSDPLATQNLLLSIIAAKAGVQVAPAGNAALQLPTPLQAGAPPVVPIGGQQVVPSFNAEEVIALKQAIAQAKAAAAAQR